MRPSRNKIIVLGLDPGIKNIGFGVVALHGNNIKCVSYGKLSIEGNRGKGLYKLQKNIKKLIKKFSPTHFAIEQVFFGKNIRSAMAVSEVRGAIISLLGGQNQNIFDMSPQWIKRYISGYGRADKKAVVKMVCMLLSIQEKRIPPDASDALAVAIAGALEAQKLSRIAY
ncbi:MAG: crossover junction endodeoxyribonuclease RuvC [Candidatus Paceibacteria bacterium]